MGKIIIEVMPKDEILDPQGKAINSALKRMGLEYELVRQGKRFELTTSADVTDLDLKNAQKAAEKLLSNPIIEKIVCVEAV